MKLRLGIDNETNICTHSEETNGKSTLNRDMNVADDDGVSTTMIF